MEPETTVVVEYCYVEVIQRKDLFFVRLSQNCRMLGVFRDRETAIEVAEQYESFVREILYMNGGAFEEVDW